MATYRLRILHISDLHLKGGSEREAWRRVRVLGDRAWTDNLRAIAAEGAIHLVCFTGDVAFSGKAEQYGQATDFFGNILARFDLDWERFFVVPGNHDIDRDIKKPAWKKLRDRLINNYPEKVSSWIRGDENPPGFTDREALLSRQVCYREWLESVGRAALLPNGKLHPTLGYRVGWRHDDWPFEIHIIGLDSAWLAGGDDDAGKLRLTDGQVGALTTESAGNGLAGFRIALVHHPLDDLADGAECRRLLADRVDLLLRGHLHEPEPSLWADPDRKLRQIAAGCLYEHDKYSNACQVLDIELDEVGRPLAYNFRFRGWSPRGHWFDDGGLYNQAPQGRLTERLVPEPARAPDEARQEFSIDEALVGPYRLEKADEADIHWIALKARDLYGENAYIPYPVKLSWFRKNPSGFWIIKNAQHDIVGSLELLPLKEPALHAFIDGNILEKEISPDNIYGVDEGANVTTLYIENFMAISDGDLPNPFAFYQSMGQLHEVLNAFPTKINHVNFYAMPVKRTFAHSGPLASCSEDLLIKLGFSKRSATKQGYPLYYAKGTTVRNKLTELGALYTYRLEKADDNDIGWIAVKACELYGTTDCIPRDVKLSWFRKNPLCFWIIKNAEHKNLGSFEILPLKEAALHALKYGNILEKEITADDIYGVDEGDKVTALYVENFMAIGEGNVPNPFACCECLLDLPRVLATLLPSNISNVKFFAMPVASFFTKDGSSRVSTSEHLLRKWLGFSRAATATKQGYPLYYANATDVRDRLTRLRDRYSKRSLFGARRRGWARVSASTSVYTASTGTRISASQVPL